MWGHGGLIVTNLYALRSTDPRVLLRHVDPIGPGNDGFILAEARACALVVCAWGSWGRDRGHQVVATLEVAGVPLYALRVNATGTPAHPLYVPYSAEPKPLGNAPPWVRPADPGVAVQLEMGGANG